MKKVVHFGPGKIGRGFFGQIYHESGYTITFVGVNQDKINMINDRREYKIYLIDRDEKLNNHSTRIRVKNIKGVSILEQSKINTEVFASDLVSTSVGANNLPNISRVLVPALIYRWENGNFNKLNILLGENKVDTDKYFRYLLSREIKNISYLKNLNDTVGIVDTSIERVVPEINDPELNSELDIIVGLDYMFPVDKDGIIGEIPRIKNIKPTKNFGYHKRRKIFVYNSLHSNLAYLGNLKGYTNIHEAANNHLISNIVYDAAVESARGLGKEYGVDIEDTLDKISKRMRRLGNTELNDTIARVAREPIRKLSSEERIFGGANLCIKNNILPLNLMLCAAGALHYYNENDEESRTLINMLQKNGIETVLKDVCGLIKGENILYDLVSNYYNLVTEIIN